MYGLLSRLFFIMGVICYHLDYGNGYQYAMSKAYLYSVKADNGTS